jgi:hypothetical protein
MEVKQTPVNLADLYAFKTLINNVQNTGYVDNVQELQNVVKFELSYLPPSTLDNVINCFANLSALEGLNDLAATVLSITDVETIGTILQLAIDRADSLK